VKNNGNQPYRNKNNKNSKKAKPDAEKKNNFAFKFCPASAILYFNFNDSSNKCRWGSEVKPDNTKEWNKFITRLNEIKTEYEMDMVFIGRSDYQGLRNEQRDDFAANYDLANSRISSIVDAILSDKEIKETIMLDSVRWFSIARVEEDEESSTQTTAQNDSIKTWRRVDIYIYPKESLWLTLLDSIYFSAYTVTTTGYGDIVPVTPYAKFVVTLANYFEAFFFLILINIIMLSKPAR